MEKVFWKKEYSVGSDYLDRQHQNLLLIVNDFNRSINKNEGTKAAYSILNRLVQYVETHFRDEELLMKSARFPLDELNAHIKEHEELTENIFALCENWTSQKEESLPKISKFLVDWLMVHIMSTDMKYSKYIAQIDDSFMRAK